MLIKEPIIKEPINIEGKTVISKNNETFVIEKQDKKIITLSNGKRYLYPEMFSSGSFVLTDKELQEKVMDDIKNGDIVISDSRWAWIDQSIVAK